MAMMLRPELKVNFQSQTQTDQLFFAAFIRQREVNKQNGMTSLSQIGQVEEDTG